MRVALRPYVQPGSSGGVQQYVQGLVGALGRVDGDDNYDVVGREHEGKWLEPYLGGKVRWVDVGAPGPAGLAAKARASWIGSAAFRARRAVRTTRGAVPTSDGFLEAAGYGVVHFPTPYAIDIDTPFLYQPWDLQHRHFPEFFARRDVQFRDLLYRHFCEHATVVIVASSFVKDDVLAAFSVEPDHVAVVPAASPLELSPELDAEAAAAFVHARSIPNTFALYPAQGWPHKNHLGLVDALALLARRGIDVPVLCTGHPTRHAAAVERAADRLGLGDRFRFLGRVRGGELRLLYERARCLLFPSLFEGFGLPVLEAFGAGVPVVCSGTTSLHELANGAAVLFDPTDAQDMADAIERVWGDDGVFAPNWYDSAIPGRRITPGIASREPRLRCTELPQVPRPTATNP